MRHAIAAILHAPHFAIIGSVTVIHVCFITAGEYHMPFIIIYDSFRYKILRHAAARAPKARAPRAALTYMLR